MHNMSPSTFSNAQLAEVSKTYASVVAAQQQQPTLPLAKVEEPQVKLVRHLLVPSTASQIVSLTPTWDDGHLVAVLTPSVTTAPTRDDETEAEAKMRSIWSQDSTATSAIVIYRIESSGLNQKPVFKLALSSADCPRCVVMLPPLEQDEEDDDDEAVDRRQETSNSSTTIKGPIRMAVVTNSGQLRLLVLDVGCEWRVHWVDLESTSTHRFTDATYCASVERICASTDKGDLVFFKTNVQGANRGLSAAITGSHLKSNRASATPVRLLIHEPLTSDTLQSLHQLTLAEKLPTSPSITAASCWMELAVTQRQRRQPQQPWLLLQPSSGGSSSAFGGGSSGGTGVTDQDALQLQSAGRLFQLQQDKFSWDEHFFEIALPPAGGAGSNGGATPLAHVHLRFALSSSSLPPDIHISLLEQRSRSLQWGRSSLNATTTSSSSAAAATVVREEVDNHINFNMGQPTLSSSSSTPAVNPVLTAEYLEAHDAVLLCGPLRLGQFVDSTGQVAQMTLGSYQLLQSTARNFLLHIKYMPSSSSSSIANSSSLVSIPRPLTNPCSSGSGGGPLRRSAHVKGCDWIQEVAISVQRCRPTSISHERAHRCALLASSTFTGQLLDFGFVSKVRREHQMVLTILNWKTAAHYAAPPSKCFVISCLFLITKFLPIFTIF